MVNTYQVIIPSKRQHSFWLSPFLFSVCVSEMGRKRRFPQNSNGIPWKCKQRLQRAVVSDISFFIKLPNFGCFCFRNYFQLLQGKNNLNEGFCWLLAFQFTFCILFQNPQECDFHIVKLRRIIESYPETVFSRDLLLSYISPSVLVCLIRKSVLADQSKLAMYINILREHLK